MGFDPATWAIIGTVASTAASVYTADKQADAQSSATEQAKQAADKQAKQADEATNRANQKSPDTSAILTAQQQAGKSGASGTMLTGAAGVDPNSLNLGKTTLLGQ